MFFRTINSALKSLNIPEGLEYLAVPNAKGSYERFEQNGRILYCVGEGRKRSPGRPGGHQYYLNQTLLKGTQYLYPVFHVYSSHVKYMGNYRFLSYKKTMSFEGFLYFEYKLFREGISEVAPVYLHIPSSTEVNSYANTLPLSIKVYSCAYPLGWRSIDFCTSSNSQVS